MCKKFSVCCEVLKRVSIELIALFARRKLGTNKNLRLQVHSGGRGDESDNDDGTTTATDASSVLDDSSSGGINDVAALLYELVLRLCASVAPRGGALLVRRRLRSFAVVRCLLARGSLNLRIL